MNKQNNNTKVNISKPNKSELSPYKKFLYSQNASYKKYKDKYFDFYDDVKDKTHKIYDW